MPRPTAFCRSAHAVLPGVLGLLIGCSAVAPPAVVAGEAPTAKPAAKISPEMVGTLSPIGVFLGQGRDQGRGWRVEIRALDPRQHHVALQWTAPDRSDRGTAVYDGPLDIARDRPLVLQGRLQTPQGVQPLRIEIRTEACRDTEGANRPQRIVLVIDGRAPLNGCGDLAMF